MKNHRDFKRSLRYGVNRPMEPTMPVVEMVSSGKRSFLWVGNDAPEDKRCFGTLSGEATLRKLALAILAEVGEKPR